MSVIEDSETPQPEPKPKAKRSPRRATSARRSSKAKRPKSPPNRVEPGWIHETLAASTLKLLHGQVVDETGQPALDVGKLPEPEPGSGESDETAPVDVLARIFAHIGHRVPGVKSIEKRLEGQDKTAGLGSDLIALIVQLAQRNRPALEALASAQAREFQAKRAAAKQKAEAKTAASEQPDTGGQQQ